jgi:anti-sigma B factor antagonist
MFSTTLVRLAGELDIANRVSTQALLDTVDADIAIIDLTDVRFIDGGALGLLVALKKRLHERGRLGVVKIIAPNRRIRRLFRITGLAKLFEIYESLPRTQAA